MKSRTVNISFNDDLLQKIDEVARQESRSRSELIRESARSYIEGKRRWNRIFDFAERQAVNKNLKENDIAEEIRNYRQSQK